MRVFLYALILVFCGACGELLIQQVVSTERPPGFIHPGKVFLIQKNRSGQIEKILGSEDAVVVAEVADANLVALWAVPLAIMKSMVETQRPSEITIFNLDPNLVQALGTVAVDAKGAFDFPVTGAFQHQYVLVTTFYSSANASTITLPPANQDGPYAPVVYSDREVLTFNDLKCFNPADPSVSLSGCL